MINWGIQGDLPLPWGRGRSRTPGPLDGEMRSSLKRALLLSVIALTTGCQAYRYPNAVALGDVAKLEPSPRPIVAVLEPEIYIDEASPAKDDPSASETQARLDRATQVIGALRETNLFVEVDFLCRLHAFPDVAIRAEKNPTSYVDPDLEIVNSYLMLISFGLIPYVTMNQRGFILERHDEFRETVRFDWPVRHVVGWFATPLPLLPEWRASHTPHLRAIFLRKYLLEQHPSLFDPDTWLQDEEARRLTRRCS